MTRMNLAGHADRADRREEYAELVKNETLYPDGFSIERLGEVVRRLPYGLAVFDGMVGGLHRPGRARCA